MAEEWITTVEAANILGVTVAHVSNLLRRGELIGQKFGRSWMVNKASVEAYAVSYRKPGPKPKSKERLDN
jgi:excisionase family DNA binding protein